MNKSDLFEDIFDRFESETKLRTLNHDVLALSCCAYRISDQLQQPFLNFENPEVSTNLSDEDFQLAEQIRSYYGKKYLWRILNERNVSEFQTTVLDFISNKEKNVYDQKSEGLIYKLPGFYFNDLVTDEIFKNADTSEIDESTPRFLRQKYTKILKFVNAIEVRTRRTKENVYWFKDNNNRLNSITIPHPNCLEHLWSDIINNETAVKIHGHYLVNQMDNKYYYKILDWKMEK